MNELFSFEPKDNQVGAIQHLLCNRSDQILIARIGFGKIIIFQTPPGSKVCEVHHCALEAITRRAGREVEDGSLGRCE